VKAVADQWMQESESTTSVAEVTFFAAVCVILTVADCVVA